MSASPKQAVIGLSAIIILALMLRLPSAIFTDLWLDEGLTITLTHWSVEDMFFLPTDPTPFIYFSLHKALIAPDMAPLVQRSLSLGFGLGTVAAMYWLGALIFDRYGGLLAALLTAVSLLEVLYSAEARAYMALSFLTVLMTVGLVGFDQARRQAAQARRRRAWLALYALSSVLAFYTHLMALFWILPTGALLLGRSLYDLRRLWLEFLLVGLVMLAMVMPGVYRLLLQLTHGHSFGWLDQASMAEFFLGQAAVYFPAGLWLNPWPALSGLAPVMAGLMAAVVLLWLGLAWRPVLADLAGWRAINIWIIGCFLLMPAVVWAMGEWVKPLFLNRNILFCAPGFILLLTALLRSLPRPHHTAVTAGVTGLYILSIALNQWVDLRSQWREAAAFLTKTPPAGSFILMENIYFYPALRHAAGSQTAATTPVLRRDSAGDVALVETGLGRSTSWSEDFFSSQMQPVIRDWYGGATRLPLMRPAYGLADTAGPGTPYPMLKAETLSGATIYEVATCCNAPMQPISDTLVLGPAQEIWRSRSGAVSIRRFRVQMHKLHP